MHNSKLRNAYYILLFAFLSCAPHFKLYGQPVEQINISSIADSGKLLERITQAAAIAELHPDSARYLLSALYKQSERAGFMRGMRHSLRNIMLIQFQSQNYREVVVLADNLLKISDPHKDKEEVYDAYLAKADSYYSLNEYYPASNAYTMALKFIPEHKTSNKPTIYSNIASILLLLKLPDKALIFYDLAISSGFRHKDFSAICKSYMGKGYIYRSKNDYQKSAVYIDSAILLSDVYAQHNDKQLALVFNADLLNQQNRFKEALSILKEAEKIHTDYPDSLTSAYRLHAIRGDTYFLSHNYNEAKKAYSTALSMVKNDANGSIYLLHELSRVYARTHNFKKAYELHCLSHNLKDSLIRQEASHKASELEVRYRVSEKDKEIALKNLKISHAEKNLAQKNLLIVSISLGALILLIILFHLYRNYHKKKRLTEKEKEIAQLRAMMEGEEKERKRLSRELHDGIGGMLAALKLKVNNLKKGHTDPALLHQIYDVIDMLQDTSSEVRTTAHNLLPDILTRLPLSEAIAHYIESINQSANIRIELHIPYPLPGMDKSVELILYRIMQELVQNVIKHAEASQIEMQLLEHQGLLTLTIEDNGVGFDTKTTGGYGLENLRYRVQGLQGEIDIDTAPGQSTTIRIAFDIEKLTSVTHT